MPSFGGQSRMRLNTCHPDLIRLFEEVVKHYDCTILCGHRGEEEQTKAFKEGRSKVEFPLSKHNAYPSLAVDAAPYPVDWDDLQRFYHIVGYVRGVAQGMGIKIRSGADWDGDFEIRDQNFNDIVHFELL